MTKNFSFKIRAVQLDLARQMETIEHARKYQDEYRLRTDEY